VQVSAAVAALGAVEGRGGPVTAPAPGAAPGRCLLWVRLSSAIATLRATATAIILPFSRLFSHQNRLIHRRRKALDVVRERVQLRVNVYNVRRDGRLLALQGRQQRILRVDAV
jgi:hypothetical protein